MYKKLEGERNLEENGEEIGHVTSNDESNQAYPSTELHKDTWKTDDSSSLYRVNEWGSDFFEVNEAGNVSVRTPGDPSPNGIDLKNIIDQLKDQHHLQPPYVLRFPDILRTRISQLIDAFDASINRLNYPARYQGCFPVKVNQQREVITEITNFADEKGNFFGLEVGTKGELLAALAEIKHPEIPLICNGYKDSDLVKLALSGQKTGINIVLVIERLEELSLIIRESKQLNIRPNLGIRIRVSSSGSGKWASTAGGKGLFGLNAFEVVDVIDRLKKHDMLDCLTMVHYHQGSQIPDINVVERAIEEVASIYVELLSEGAGLNTINVGGGLAIDYEGAGIAGPMSKNYSLQQYADTIVSVLSDFARANDIPPPNIISESGRAITSHYSVFVFEILRSEIASPRDLPLKENPTTCAPLLRLRKLVESPDHPDFDTGDLTSLLLSECEQQFSDGRICIRELAEAQRLQRIIFDQISTAHSHSRKLLNSPKYADYYYGNFSLFQSMPDSWAIDQVFPIMPIHRLNEIPDKNAIVADITCDCDGKVKTYVDRWDELASLPLHPLNPDEPYYLGVFLVGSYQETLGNFHNLLGRPAIATIRNKENGTQEINTTPCDKTSRILEHVRFDIEDLKSKFAVATDIALKNGHITEKEKMQLLQTYNEQLDGSSYLRC